MPKPSPRTGQFQYSFHGKPAIIVTNLEWSRALKFGREANPVLVRYATAPTQTEVWLRYGVRYDGDADTGTARWQCQARIVHSKIVGTDGDGDYFAHRLKLTLFGDEERTDRT